MAKDSENTLDPQKLHFISANVEVMPMDVQHVAILWETTLADNEPNQRLFRQIYGTRCDSANNLATVIDERRHAGTHYPLAVKGTHNAVPTSWMVVRPRADGTPSPLLIARFLETILLQELGLEALYLLHCHIFEDLRHDSVQNRYRSLESHELDKQWSLLGSFRRSLYVPEPEGISDLYFLSKEKWPSTKVATAAWLGIQLPGQEEMLRKSAQSLGL